MRVEDEPYALHSEEECHRRRLLLAQAHIKPLSDFLDTIRAKSGSAYDIPCFDPCDGGIEAKALFLLEAPGPKAVNSGGHTTDTGDAHQPDSRAVGSGYVSRNNPDQTAKNICALMQSANIERRDTILWNIVPWYVGNGQNIRPVDAQDMEKALPHLPGLLALLPNLQVIVLLGKKAQLAEVHIQKLIGVPIVRTYHPSPRVFNRWPEKKKQAHDAFLSVAKLLVW